MANWCNVHAADQDRIIKQQAERIAELENLASDGATEMFKQITRAETARLVDEVASWKALVQHKCGVVRGMVKFYKVARAENAAQAEQIKRLREALTEIAEETTTPGVRSFCTDILKETA